MNDQMSSIENPVDDEPSNLGSLGQNDHQVKIRGFRIELGEIEAVLQRHPAIAQAAVIIREDQAGCKQLVGYIVFDKTSTERSSDMETRQIAEWQNICDIFYDDARNHALGENFSGWNSSYNDQPIPLPDMQAWRADTVARIRALRPRRLLEIGVGSGLLLAHLAPHCKTYWGTDFSAPTIDALRVQIAQHPELASRIELRTQAAHITEGLPSDYFDTIVINSVAQCFPSASYLLDVLRQAMALLVPGGAVFIGDVRNLHLLNCFASAVQLHHADPTSDDGASLRRRIKQTPLTEKELLLAPAFFSTLPQTIDTIAAVDIQLKRGDYRNELSRYRYEVVLRKGPINTLSLAQAPQLCWGKDVIELGALRTHLVTKRPAYLRVTRVPNVRLASDVEAMQALQDGSEIGAIQHRLKTGDRQAIGFASEVFHALGESLGYWVGATWSEHDAQACMDILFVQANDAAQATLTDLYLPAPNADKQPLGTYANNPSGFYQLVDIRRYVATQLPEYMVPAAVVLLDALPLTPNGKLDRRALPAPDGDAFAQQAYEALQGKSETALLGVGRVSRHDEYWRKTLADAPVLLDLPTARTRPAQQSFAGARVPVRLDAEMTLVLKHLSQQHGSTLFMILLAAWGAVLARLSGQVDLVIGTLSANRRQCESEPPIGFFANTLALRIDLSGEPDTTQLLKRVRHSVLAAQAHQDSPFEQVVETMQRSRRLDYTSLFQVMFVWQNNEMGEWRLPNLEEVSTEPRYDTVKFDLELNLSEKGDEIVGDLLYATVLFDRQTIERHVGYLHAMLRAMAADARQPIATIDILAPAERECLLETWNATESPYQTHLCIHQLFEAQVEHKPEATALVFEEQALNYAELNARANRLAHQLIELGVQPDTRVAICVERSPLMVVGLLAILKAGGAYVPLDPAYPSERLAYILADATPAILLADAVGRAALGEEALASLTVLDPNRLPQSPITNPQVPELSSRHLAYVIYTSGSTGTPKGVMIEHRGVVNLAQAQPAYFGVHTSSRVLQFASLSFDASVWEIFMALGCGASLYMPPDTVRRDRNELWDYLARYAITHVTLPPALLQDGENLPSLSTPLTLILAGETPRATLLQTLIYQSLVFNAYGPTETTVCATTWFGSRGLSGEVVPIGRPIANTRVYLLDKHGQPAPLGVVGELYIGGVGVARGYLNRPELTAERFLTDPFNNSENARMYKTGDLARYLPDGNLEFLGRNDHQIKIRGFRIELGEIETRLVEHPQVREAAVFTLGEGTDKRLIAYVVAEPDEQLARTLHSHLAAKLPEYMMPAAFVRLDVLPLTLNGKIDRRALPAPNDEAFAHQAYEAPQGEIETVLAGIWAELLNVEQISRHDNFFAFGGHSLLAIRMINRIRTTLGVEILFPTLFESPTVAKLAQHVLRLDGSQGDSFSVLLPIQPKGTRPPLFCIHSAIGLSWNYSNLSKHLDADQPIYGLQARGLNGVSPLAETIDAMASDYITQMRRIQPNGPYCLLGWCFGGNVAHSIAVQLEQQGEKVMLLAFLDVYNFPDYPQLANGPERDLESAAIEVLARYGDPSIPDVGEYLWEKTKDVIKNNLRLTHHGKSFPPPIYGGDALFFRATIPEGEFLPLTSPDLWKPYVLGNIEVYDIHCKHVDITDKPVPMAEVGRILADKLDELQKHQPPRGEESFLV